MALQFLSHNWQVENVEDGIVVHLSQQDLDSQAIWILVDELLELAQECAKPNLYVDFETVRCLASIVFGKLITLDKRLRDIDCRLILTNVDSFLYKSFRAARLTENLDIRASAAAELV